MKESTEMTVLAEAADTYRRTKDAHRDAAAAARQAVLTALLAGVSVPDVTKASPFTYAYVRSIAAEHGIPRDERKARLPKRSQQ